jgi:hypothetical protein
MSLIGHVSPAFGLLFYTLMIIAFLGFNTFFLISEQSSLYLSLGYSAVMAWLIAILMESALLLFSYISSWSGSWFWKVILYAGCGMIAIVVVQVLDASAQHRGAEKIAGSERAAMLRKEISTLETLEAAALASIKGLDPKVYPTKISRLAGKLNSPGFEGYTYRLGILRGKLAGIKGTASVEAEISLMKWQRRVLVLCNIILASFLGFLWREKKRSFSA